MRKENTISKISVIMVDAGFREKFHLIDFLNDQTLAREDYELIWVEYYDKVRKELTNKRGVRIFTLNKTGKPYHMAYCFNEGIRQSLGDLLVIMDADLVVNPTFLETIKEEHEKCPELAMYLQRWDEPKEKHKENISLQHLKKVCIYRNPRNYGGCLSVRKKWLLTVNGYEQHPIFAGLHALAMDMYTRLKNLGLHIKWHPTERVYHPWHPGTLAPSESYILQLKVVEGRARSLTTLPYIGLDGKVYKPSNPQKFIQKRGGKERIYYCIRQIGKRMLNVIAK